VIASEGFRQSRRAITRTLAAARPSHVCLHAYALLRAGASQKAGCDFSLAAASSIERERWPQRSIGAIIRRVFITADSSTNCACQVYF
jgi:hypothetical protein